MNYRNTFLGAIILFIDCSFAGATILTIGTAWAILWFALFVILGGIILLALVLYKKWIADMKKFNEDATERAKRDGKEVIALTGTEYHALLRDGFVQTISGIQIVDKGRAVKNRVSLEQQAQMKDSGGIV